MNVNDLESRMWDYQFQAERKKTSLFPKQHARTRGQSYNWFGRAFRR
jgi:hypothetical protein